MIEIPITFTQREKAHQVALGRNGTNRQLQRPDAKYSRYDSVETDWQGALAEIVLLDKYPQLKTAQPLIVKSLNTRNTDFKLRDAGIEVKCCRFNRQSPRVFFLNLKYYQNVKPYAKFFIFCGIDDSPQYAQSLFIFGYIEKEQVESYSINYDILSQHTRFHNFI